MAGFNGSGTFSRVYSSWVADRVAGTPITDTRMDDEFTGFVTGLTTTICRDGQSTTTARIPFAAGVNVMTGAAAAVGLSITGDVGTGLWSSGATTNLSIAVAGTTRLSAGTAGVAVTGTLSSSGVFTGTTTAVFGANSGTGGAVKLYGATSGDATIKVAAAAGTSTIFQVPASNGTSGYVLTTDGSGVTSWLNPASIAGDLDVGTTAIVGGTTTRILYNNAGVLGEYTLSGTGTIVAMTAGPTFTGTIAGAALTLSTPLGAASGGTGVANNAASTLTISGNFATTLTVSATTGVTLPTTGTLATLAGTETFTNKTLTTAILNGTVTGTSQATANTASTLVMRDASGNFAAGTITANLTGNASGTALTVTQAAQTAITSLGTLTGLTMGGTLAVGSNALTSTGTMTSGVHTLAAAGPQIILGADTTVLGSVKMFGNTSGDVTLQPAAVAGTATVITLPAVTGTLATLAGTETFTNKTLTTAVLNGTITGTSQATANTASTLVMRDASGNFSAGTITTSTLAATTINAFTLGGTVAGGGNQINNVIIGTSTPLAGSFTTIAGSGIISLTNTTASTSTTSGALVVGGGAGIAGATYIGGHLSAGDGFGVAGDIAGYTAGTAFLDVTSSLNGRLQIAGSNSSTVGTFALSVGTSNYSTNYTALSVNNTGIVSFPNTTEASAVGTASVVMLGGLSVAGSYISDGNVSINGFTNTSEYRLRLGFAVASSGGVGLGAVDISGDSNKDGLGLYGHDGIGFYTSTGTLRGTFSSAGVLSILNTTDASAIGTASVVLAGGLSVAKNIYVGGQADGTINIASTSGSSWLVAARGLILHVPNNFTAQITTNGTNRFNIATSGEITVSSSTTASSTSAAALVVTGGVGIGDNLRVANAIIASGTITSVSGVIVQSTADMFLTAISTGTIQSAGVRLVGRQSSVDSEWSIVAAGSGLTTEALRFVPGVWTGSPAFTLNGQTLSTGKATVSYSTTASSTSAAALVVTGGVGIGDNLRVANIAHVGSLRSDTPSAEHYIGTQGNSTPGVGNTNGGMTWTVGPSAEGPAVYISRQTATPLTLSRNDDGMSISFRRNDSAVGSVTVAAGATTYNTTSDETLKMLFDEDGIDWGERIDRVWVGGYQAKADPGRWRLGIRAQQAYGILPQGVTRPKTISDIYTADYGLALAPLALWGVKELRPRMNAAENSIAALTAELTAAKARIEQLEKRMN